jgi:hypothetical protein
VLPFRLGMLPPQLDGVEPHEALSVLADPRPDRNVIVLSIAPNPFTVNINYSTTNLSTLGVLDKLPLELLNAILRGFDIRTVFKLRMLNRRMRMIIDTFSPYKTIARHAPEVVAALIRTGVASFFTLDKVHYALCTPACHVCGKLGSFLWIPGCIRCCFPCLLEEPELMPMTKQDAKAAFGLTESSLVNVPIMTTLPGTYTLDRKPYRRERLLVSRERARQVAVVVHGGEEGLEKYIKFGKSKAKVKYEEQAATKWSTWGDRDSKGRENRTIQDITRYMSAMPFPYFDINTQTTPSTFTCKGCEAPLHKEGTHTAQEYHALIIRRDQKFTQEEFFEHFKECPEVQGLWKEHQEEEEKKKKRKPTRTRRR